ncbi:KAT8 regulatory NSL complex subunit 2 [Anopheles cruzii]|uniref:KAT8 regulatory NSL complex subunit 2 n=1 Tax=Anopheles cruzii TaxID=68878 RepID=UPI0022EC848B|nr:KAT8 regulatory NSL complex subunit 2 [Anopheles cruzii]
MGPQPQPMRPAVATVSSSSNASTIDQHDKNLRTQIYLDIERKAKSCSYTLYECSLPRLDSYAYCFRHILQEPDAPYKQCGYYYANGKRCGEPSPKYDAKKDYGTNYCFEHSRQTQLSKTKSTIGKLVPVETTETLLHSLAHHAKVDKIKQHSQGNTPLKITVHEDDDDNDVDVVTPSVDPFVDVDVTSINDSRRIVLDYASDSSSNEEETLQPTYGGSWKGHDMDNSDNESVDSQGDDPLKHAGIYTAEEVTRITKEKLSRLQSLYVQQLHRLQHVLCDKRRTYLQDLRKERETRCSIYDQIQETPRERQRYAKLKGLNRYHRKYGVESILQRKYLEKRAKATEGLQQKPPSLPKCAYTEGGVKCGERTLPCCKFCRKHILEDKKQVLFRVCGIEKGGVICQEPLATLFENATCPLHVELPAQRTFNKRKYESESEGEVELSVVAVDEKISAGTAGPSTDKPNGADEQQQLDQNDVAESAEQATVKLVEPKTEVSRKGIKQETTGVTASSPRTRNTRAARAALERKQKEVEDQISAIIKQEQQDREAELTKPLVEHNVTIAHDVAIDSLPTLDTPKDSAKSSDIQDTVVDSLHDIEDKLPVSVIETKSPKHEAQEEEQIGAETNPGMKQNVESEQLMGATTDDSGQNRATQDVKSEPASECPIASKRRRVMDAKEQNQKGGDSKSDKEELNKSELSSASAPDTAEDHENEPQTTVEIEVTTTTTKSANEKSRRQQK